jgi:hypothetical protein|tara:strand:+ start:52 stop:576 length:525 start_codon:yes stop_codon:yes gene_type:complete
MTCEEKNKLNRSRALCLRKMLADDVYFTVPNTYQTLLSDLLTKLHQNISSFRKRNAKKPSYHSGRDLSPKQYKVIEDAITRYQHWLTKDKIDPEFQTKRDFQENKVIQILRHLPKGYSTERGDESMKRICFDLLKQLKQRKILLTNKQKVLCNDFYKRVKDNKEIYLKNIKKNG